MERRKEEVEFVERVFNGCLVLTFESEEKWLAKRREFLCASDTAAILGIGFKSNQTIWEDKCDPEAVKKRSQISPQVEMAMAKGKLSESHVRNQYMIDYGITVFDGTNMLLVDTRHLDSNGNPFMAATLDAWFMSSGENSVPTILEIKRTESWKTFGTNPPLGYRAQVLKQMIVTGAKKAVLVGRVLFESSDTGMTYGDALSLALPDIPVLYQADIGHTIPSMTMINGAILNIDYENHKSALTFSLK